MPGQPLPLPNVWPLLLQLTSSICLDHLLNPVGHLADGVRLTDALPHVVGLQVLSPIRAGSDVPNTSSTTFASAIAKTAELPAGPPAAAPAPLPASAEAPAEAPLDAAAAEAPAVSA